MTRKNTVAAGLSAALLITSYGGEANPPTATPEAKITANAGTTDKATTQAAANALKQELNQKIKALAAQVVAEQKRLYVILSGCSCSTIYIAHALLVPKLLLGNA